MSGERTGVPRGRQGSHADTSVVPIRLPFSNPSPGAPSFRHHAFREMGVVEIESEWTGRDRELKVTGGQPRVFLCPS